MSYSYFTRRINVGIDRDKKPALFSKILPEMKLSNLLGLFLLFLPFLALQAQTADPAVSFAATITPADLRSHLTRLASVEFEGRETGTPGQQKAARYLADFVAQLGLPAIGDNQSHLQQISFISQSWKTIEMELGGKTLRHLWDYYSYPARNHGENRQEFKEAVFLGYGIDDPAYSDYGAGAEVNNKLLVVYDGEPLDKNGKSLLTKQAEPSTWSTDWRRKVQAAKAKGAAAVLIIDRNFKENLASARKTILSIGMEIGRETNLADQVIPNYYISSEVAKELFGSAAGAVIKSRDRVVKKGTIKPVKFACNLRLHQFKRTNTLEGSNVLGLVEGTDPRLKQEYVVVTAHYDHLGKRGESVYFGADDNASGTSTVLEVCQAFVAAKNAGVGPKRSVLFMWVSGEEKGLLGSQYYSENPIFPLAQTVVNVNVDMVGRVDSKHEQNPDYIYVIGADRLSSELHQINEAANARYTQLELDYTYNAESDPNRYYYRSDHYNFASKGIPAIFYFNGTHADYHRTSDTVEKINFEKMAKIGRLVFHTSWELANRAERIKVDKQP